VSIKLLVRNACDGSEKKSGTARLWYGDGAADSRFGAPVAKLGRTYFLGKNFALLTTPGPDRKMIDVAAGTRCGTYKAFGTWSARVQ
jgi:hypothetical protein